jgi:hypothetical protein
MREHRIAAVLADQYQQPLQRRSCPMSQLVESRMGAVAWIRIRIRLLVSQAERLCIVGFGVFQPHAPVRLLIWGRLSQQTMGDRTRAKRLVDRFLSEELEPMMQDKNLKEPLMEAAQ